MKKREGRLTRREFFARSLSGAAAAGVLAAPGRLFASPISQQAAPSQTPNKEVIYRNLGKTGMRLPIVNMGVMNAYNPELVKRSYDIGVRHFDTSAYYQRGQNEAMIGKAIRELGVRDRVVIGTKVFVPHEQRRQMTSADLKKFFLDTAEESLRRLQTDFLDILYVHNVQDLWYLNNPGIREALQILKDQNKVRRIGFTVHSNMTELLLDAAGAGFYEVIAVAFNYAMADDTGLISALQKAQERGIGLIAMKTQCTQYWYREYVPSDKQSYYQGKILHTAVLKWALRHDFITCAIPGYTTFEQMELDFSVASDLEYTPEERKFLEDRGVKLALMSYCRQCHGCLPTCPNGVDVPALMRAHLYAACYGNFFQARDTLSEIPKEKGLAACESCETCTARCVRLVDIPRRLQELRLVYA